MFGSNLFRENHYCSKPEITVEFTSAGAHSACVTTVTPHYEALN